jgi:hypothetical protein
VTCFFAGTCTIISEAIIFRWSMVIGWLLVRVVGVMEPLLSYSWRVESGEWGVGSGEWGVRAERGVTAMYRPLKN